MAGYTAAWKKYKGRRNRAILVFLSILPVFLFFTEASKIFADDRIANTVWTVAGLCWLFATAFTYYQAQLLRCPRCGNYFAPQGWPHRGAPFFVRRCAHCGLPKYAANETQTNATEM
jgi:hypothetical protein